MAEIKININSLSEEIENLRGLYQKINKSNIKTPEIIGGGVTIQELEAIEALYKSIHLDIGELVLSTISFMENVSKSYQTSDRKSAMGFR